MKDDNRTPTEPMKAAFREAGKMYKKFQTTGIPNHEVISDEELVLLISHLEYIGSFFSSAGDHLVATGIWNIYSSAVNTAHARRLPPDKIYGLIT